MADTRGVYDPVLPLDVLLLKAMPKEGAMFMGVYPEAASISDIKKQIADGQLPSTLLATRLRVLHLFGYVINVKVPKSPTAGWQVTAKGEQFVREQDASSTVRSHTEPEPGDGNA